MLTIYISMLVSDMVPLKRLERALARGSMPFVILHVLLEPNRCLCSIAYVRSRDDDTGFNPNNNLCSEWRSYRIIQMSDRAG